MNSRNAALVLCLTMSFGFIAQAEEAVQPAADPEVAKEPQAVTTGGEAAATATDAAPAAEASAPATEATAPGADAKAPATDADAKAKTASASEDPIVCKTVAATGTRIRKGRVCKPESAWRNIEKIAEDVMSGIERGASAGVGGQDVGGG